MEAFGKQIEVKFWDGEHLGDDFSADTETELIQSDSHIPRLAVTTAYALNGPAYIIKNKDIHRFFHKHLESEICWHNASFDLSVLETHKGMQFHERILADRVLDTRILYRLLCIATQGWADRKTNLAHCIKKAFDVELDKDSSVRLTFGEYINEDGSVNYNDIPEEHYEYAAKDAVATEMLKRKILKKIQTLPTSTNLSHKIQLMGEIALDDIRRRGVCIDLPYADSLREELDTDMEANLEVMKTYGLVRGQKGFQQKYEEIVKHLDLNLPVTGKSRKVSMSADDLQKYKGMHFVDALLDYLAVEKRRAFLKLLTVEKVHPRYESIMNTLRTSCSKPNVQNPPRKGGIRECFIPTPGKVFVDIDYSSIELYALAYMCKKDFGHSVLYDKLQAGADVHVYAASKIFNISEDKVDKGQRQIAKICNYGLAANMGKDTFSKHMGDQGVDLSPEAAGEVKNAWKAAFPEIAQCYWKGAQNRTRVVTDTGFIRNDCTYTAFLNTPFQSKVAEGIKIAMYNCKIAGLDMVMMIHDEIVFECDKDKVQETVDKASEIMIESMQRVMPGMSIKVDAVIRDRHGK